VTARAVRRLALGVCAVAVAGMIVSSVRDATGAALAFGLAAAVATLCSIVATAVAGGGGDPEVQGAKVEALVAELVAAGADEAAVRRLVREAARLGRAAGPG
jgi:hypothetical protein